MAGTEKGVTEPQATFSTCFGAPFMPRHPTVYAKMLGEKMARQQVKCWLVNTGWSGGGFGVGERMSIRHTRAMVRAALDGTLAAAASSTDPHFGMQVPSACPDVPGEVLNPKNTWKDKKAYDERRALTSPSASRRTSCSSRATSTARSSRRRSAGGCLVLELPCAASAQGGDTQPEPTV